MQSKKQSPVLHLFLNHRLLPCAICCAGSVTRSSKTEVPSCSMNLIAYLNVQVIILMPCVACMQKSIRGKCRCTHESHNTMLCNAQKEPFPMCTADTLLCCAWHAGGRLQQCASRHRAARELPAASCHHGRRCVCVRVCSIVTISKQQSQQKHSQFQAQNPRDGLTKVE